MYLCEAHALETWPLSPNAPKNHSSLSDRHQAIEQLLRKFPRFNSLLDECLIDHLDDASTISNGLWPERYLLLQGGLVAWASDLSSGSEVAALGKAASELL